jgi:outer membrane protein assembly factor BamB
VANGAVYFGSKDHNVYALNASTGAKLWSYATGNQVYHSPAVVNGVVYAGSWDNKVYALNANTGAKLWSYDTGYQVGDLAVANAVVYVATDYGNLYALNAARGAKLWNFQRGDYMTQFSGPAVANGVVYVGSGDGAEYAVNASTGVLLWDFITYGSQSPAAVANGVVYVGPIVTGPGSVVYALDAGTGALLWSYNVGFGYWSGPAESKAILYVASGGFMYAFGLGNADLFLRIQPTPTTVHEGDLITYAFPVWNLGPNNADYEVLNTQVPAGTTLEYTRISGTPGLGTCTTPPYQGTGKIVCYENSAMAPNTTWTVRVVVKVTAPAGTVITENAATMADTFDPNLANNTATVNVTVQ